MKLEDKEGVLSLPLYVTNPICGNIDATNLRIEFFNEQSRSY